MEVKILRGRKFMAIGVVSCLKSNILQNVLLFAVINIYIYTYVCLYNETCYLQIVSSHSYLDFEFYRFVVYFKLNVYFIIKF
jgi:hypothetical protein